MKIHTVYQSYRKKPYVARWYEPAPDSAKDTPGKPRQRNRFFASERSRAEFIARAERASARQDAALPDLPPHQLMRWQQAVQLAPVADPVEVYRFWVEAKARESSQANRNLVEASEAFLSAMERMRRNPSHIGHVRRALDDLIAETGDRNLRELSTESIRLHLHGLPYQPVTIRHRRTNLGAAFRWWAKQGWIDANPVSNVEAPRILDKEPGVLSVAEARALFRSNERIDPGVCGLLALGAFAGMRSSAVARLDHGEIDFTQRGILTPAEKTKKGRRQWIEDLPENLWEWLRRAPRQSFELTERQVRHRVNMAYKRAGLLIEADDISRENARRDRTGEEVLTLRPKCPPKFRGAQRRHDRALSEPDHCLRHSFVTYHVALHRNPGKTALIISHRDQDCLYRHYLGIANQKDATEYFKIHPKK